METIYIGPSCPRCVNNEYTKQLIGTVYWKKCTECGRLSPIVEGELTEKPAE